MPFFDELPEELPSVPEPRRERWRGISTDTIGVPVPLLVVLAKTDDVAVIVGNVVAYPAGFGLSVIAIWRMSPPQTARSTWTGYASNTDQRSTQGLRFGIGFADGSKVTNELPRRLRPPAPGERSLVQGGGSGDGRTFTNRFWCEPLPPPGELTFACEWRLRGIAETEHVVDARTILDASARAEPIWPEDVGLAELE